MRFSLGLGTRNALLNRSFSNAAYRQTALEHQQYIDDFAAKRMAQGQSPAEAYYYAENIDEPEQIEQYWNDFEPRRDLGGSSSWINEVEHLPDEGISILHTNGGKQIMVPQTSEEAGDMITSDSIGQYYNNFLRNRG